MTKNRIGYRGYIGCRRVYGSRVPQHIQNLVIRDYAARKDLMFKLSAVEYAMEGSFLVLRQVEDELPTLEGIILYNMFMLPDRKADRIAIYERVLSERTELHAAVESMVLRNTADIDVWEDIIITRQITSTIDYSEAEQWLSSTS